MSKKLTGKVALVTGGSRGIGAATAQALAVDGADVAISYVASADKAEAVVRELEGKGVRAAAFRADQADPAQVEGLVKAVVERFGHLDILVNNAGVSVIGAVDNPENNLAEFDRQFAINVGGVVAAIRAASRVMGAGGRIISISSIAATRAGFPGVADYAATKAAIVGYTKGAARDLAPRANYRQRCDAWPRRHRNGPRVSGPLADGLHATIALGRYGRPEEIAAAIVFLASPGASVYYRFGAGRRWWLWRVTEPSSYLVTTYKTPQTPTKGHSGDCAESGGRSGIECVDVVRCTTEDHRPLGGRESPVPGAATWPGARLGRYESRGGFLITVIHP